ncbi:MAG: putative toxin-antitoxin system toxin component, PIN family [Nitrospiraceae bacterium]|nr:putative toxin-antitoxin system toxin component, PIN family [Nitrospiraceae bacterium]
MPLKPSGERLTRKRSRVVIDTGVLISAFAFDGIPEKAVRKAFKHSEIFVSPLLIEEYRDTPLKLEKRGKITHQQMKALIAGIAAFVANAKMVHPSKRVSLCRDPEDNMVIECCLAAKAGILITGDKDLLDIDDLPFDLQIITPLDFVGYRDS